MSEVADYERKRREEERDGLIRSIAIHDVQPNADLPVFAPRGKIRSARKQQLLALVDEIGRDQFRCVRVNAKDMVYIRSTLAQFKKQGRLPADLSMRQHQVGDDADKFEVYLIRKGA